MPRRFEKIVQVVCAIVIVAALGAYLLSWFAGRLLGRDHTNELSFDRQVWVSEYGEAKARSPRAQMIGDLLPRLKPGMASSEVIQLLGKPDEVLATKTWRYGLGSWNNCSLCPDYLVIPFDAEGRLIKAELKEM